MAVMREVSVFCPRQNVKGHMECLAIYHDWKFKEVEFIGNIIKDDPDDDDETWRSDAEMEAWLGEKFVSSSGDLATTLDEAFSVLNDRAAEKYGLFLTPEDREAIEKMSDLPPEGDTS